MSRFKEAVSSDDEKAACENILLCIVMRAKRVCSGDNRLQSDSNIRMQPRRFDQMHVTDRPSNEARHDFQLYFSAPKPPIPPLL